MPSWHLDNVEITSKEHPDSFFIPSVEERSNQTVGDLVKLIFLIKDPGEDSPRAERMWVEITEVHAGKSRYKGLLTNQPFSIQDLHVGDMVEFGIEHIAATVIKKDDPRWVDCSEQKALVSKMCLEPGATIRFLYREEPDNEEDSGWRLFTGYETEEYNADHHHIQVMNVGYLLDKDPTLLEPLKNEGYDLAFEREEKDKPWVKVEDWQPGE